MKNEKLGREGNLLRASMTLRGRSHNIAPRSAAKEYQAFTQNRTTISEKQTTTARHRTKVSDSSEELYCFRIRSNADFHPADEVKYLSSDRTSQLHLPYTKQDWLAVAGMLNITELLHKSDRIQKLMCSQGSEAAEITYSRTKTPIGKQQQESAIKRQSSPNTRRIKSLRNCANQPKRSASGKGNDSLQCI